MATGVNTCRRDADPVAHGEVEAIRAACRRLGTFDLSGAIVVSSCHPCPICQALAGMTGISRIAYAATREEAADGGFGFSDAMASVLDQVDGVMVELEHVAVERPRRRSRRGRPAVIRGRRTPDRSTSCAWP